MDIRRRRLLLASAAILRRLPFESALRLCELAAEIALRTAPGARRRAAAQLRSVVGDELSANGRDRIVRAAARNAAHTFCEAALLAEVARRADAYVESEGWPYLETILAAGRGVLAVSGLCGNWEMFNLAAARRGLAVAAIAQRLRDSAEQRRLEAIREQAGVLTIHPESPHARRAIASVLARRGVLSMLIDPTAGRTPPPVPSFAPHARSSTAAALLALRLDLVVVPVAVQRRAEGGHRVSIQPPIEFVPTDTHRRDIHVLTRLCNETLAERIRRNPAEWAWWHHTAT